MQRSGVNILKFSDELTTFGFFEGLRNYSRLKKDLYELTSQLNAFKPDIFVPISFGGFNLKLAKKLKQIGTKIIYFAPPQLWAWGKWRVKELSENTNKVICLFPFEKKFFQDLGIDAIYLGNPLLDYVEQEYSSKSVILSDIPINSKIITFMPGSRTEEIKHHLPLMIKIFKKLKLELNNLYGFVITENNDYLPNIDKLYYTKEGKYQIMAKSDLIVLSSGTASLEAAILKVPHIAIYHLSTPSYLLARVLVKVKNFALTNLILHSDIVPELIQPTFPKLYPIVLKLLNDSNNVMIEQLSRIKNILGQPGSIKRIVQEIIS
jgi:lipid-A-disaccharide synthase